MYQFKASPDLLPVMPGDRLYSVTNYALDDEPYYAEGVVITEDSLQVVLNGEVYDLGDGLFPSREEALDWIEKNRRPSILESLISAVRDRLFGAQVYYRQAQSAPLTARMVARLARPLKTEGEVRPTDIAPVIAPDSSHSPTVYPMVWGFTNPREGGKPLVNCCVETAGFKPFWKESWQRRRCIIPCSYYFEWEHFITVKGEKKTGQKYMIQPTGALVTYLAGLYNIEERDGMRFPVFTVLTREPGEEISFIHDRMPVILGKESAKAWMEQNIDPKDVVKAALTDMYFEKVNQ